MATSIDDISRELEKFGRQLGGSGSTIEKLTNQWQAAAQQGINFSGDAIGLRTSIMTTRMSVDEWNKAIDVGRQGFTGLGGSMNDSVKVFNRLSKEFSDAGDIVDPLRQMGYSTADYNQLLVLTLNSQRRLNVEDSEQKKKLFESTAAMAKEMDTVSQLTGKQRSEMMSEMEQRKNDFRYQAMIELETRKGNKAAVEGLNTAMTKLSATGLDKLGQALSTGQVLNEQQRSQMQVLGAAGTELQQAMMSVKNARTTEEKDIALARVDRAQALAAERMHSTEVLNMVQRGTGDFIEHAGQLTLSTRNLNDSLQTTAEQNPGADIVEAQKIAADKIKQAQVGEDKEGKLRGAATTELYLKSQARVNDLLVPFAENIQKVNERVGGGILSNNAELLKDLSNVTKEGKPIEPLGGVLGKTSESIDKGTLIKDLPGIVAGGLEKGFEKLKELTVDVLHVTANTVNPPNSPPTEEKPKLGMSTGSKDVLGDWFKGNFGSGTDVTLHGSEAVVPKERVNEFISDMQQSMGVKGVPVFDEIFNKVNQIDFKSITDQASASIPKISDLDTTTESTGPSEMPSASLSDINNQLVKLNDTMIMMAKQTNTMIDSLDRQYNVTKKLSPNVNMM